MEYRAKDTAIDSAKELAKELLSKGNEMSYQTKSPDYYCRWCGEQVHHMNEFFPFCSKEHANKDEERFHRELAIPQQIKLWAKFINHQLAAWAAIFELITGNKPPKIKEVLAVISGH